MAAGKAPRLVGALADVGKDCGRGDGGQLHAPFGRLLPRPPDGEAGDVDPDRVRAVGGGQQGLLPRAATGVEHPSGQQALLREPHESRLRPADVPRSGRRRGV